MPAAVLESVFLPAWALVPALLAVPLIVVSGRHPNLREFWTLAASVLQFGLVLALLGKVRGGESISCELLELAPGIGLRLSVDALGIFFGLIASGLWILTSLYSIGYMRGNQESRQTRYFASFALSLFATLGVAFSGNLLTFVVFYELLTLATYPLVIHKETPEAIRAGRQYLAYSLSAGLLLLAGAGWMYAQVGTLEFRAGGVFEGGEMGAGSFRGLFLLFLAGVGVKSGVMPLHSWLPNAMVAPTPVSALLHAVAVVKSGVFGVVRMVGFVFGPEVMRSQGLDVLLAGFAGGTILLASLIALRQDSLKRRLAYSTIGHLSYVVLGVAMLSPEGFLGGVFHISTHAVMKITLFFCAGAIYVNTHCEKVSQLDGIGKAMPWTMGAFAVGSLGLVGLPPINGFFSKWYLCAGSLQSGWIAALAVLLVSGLLNAAYLLPILQRAYFRSSSRFDNCGEASPWMVVPLCTTALLALVLGIAPNLGVSFFELAREASAEVMNTARDLAGASQPFSPPLP